MLHGMPRRWIHAQVRKVTATSAILALAAASMAPAAALAYSGPVAFAATTCSLAGKYRSLGPTYAEKLSVSHTSCSTGVSLIKSFNRCRLAHGGPKGYCRGTVLGFRCSERRNSSSIQFISQTHCTSGSKVVNFTYTEDT